METQKRKNAKTSKLPAWPILFSIVGMLAGAVAGHAQTTQPTTAPGEDALEAARRAAMASIQQPTTKPAAATPATPQQHPGAPRQAGVRHSPLTSPSRGPTPGTEPARLLPGPLTPTPPKSPMELADEQRAKQPTTTSAPAGPTTITFNVRPVDPEARSYRFDYQATPWTDVLADFSRMSGLSFLNQPDPPITEMLTFHSPKNFTYQEALDQLNELLLARPLNKFLIQREDRFLTIKRLPDLMREIPANRMFNSFEEMERSRPGQFEIVLVNWDVPEGWSPYEIIETYRPMFSDTYGTQVKGKRLELTGLVREHRRFNEVVRRLTEIGPPPQNDPRDTLMIQLKHAKAGDVQTNLRQIFPISAPAAPGRGPGVDQTAETAKKIDILVEMRTNTLIIKAPKRTLDEISQLVAKLDQGKPAQLPLMKVIKLEYADANMLVGSLKQIFAAEKQALLRDPSTFISPEEKASLERDIFVDQASNSVILVGGAEGLASAEKLVKEWDVPTENQISEIVVLKHADAGPLSAALTQLFPPMNKPGQVPDRITARTSKSLVVTATKQNFQKIRDLIEKLDAPPDDEAKEHLVKLKNAMPTTIATVLQQAMSAGMGSRVISPANRGQVPPMPQPGQPGTRYIPDDATGVLIVYCSDQEWAQAEPLIKRLDDQAGQAKPRLEKFPLAKAYADDIANLLRAMFPQQAPMPGVKGGAAQSSFFADSYNNILQVYGTADFIAEVTPFIQQLDIESSAGLTVIKLAHAKAEAILPTLSQVVNNSRPTGQPISPQQPIAGGRPGGPLSVSSGQVRITAEPMTNSLLVSAPAKELEQIKTLVASMDAAAESTSDSRVILEVKHRSAEELAGSLRSLASGGGAKTPGVAGIPTAGKAGVNIVAAGKQIILDGPRDDVAKLIQVFEQLDVPYEQPLFRKYAVMDAEEDEKKLRTMLAMQPAAPKSTANPAMGGQPMQKVPPVSLSAPEAISIYADTFENTLLVGVKVESDFVAIETLLGVIFADARPIKGHEDIAKYEGDFFTIQLKNRKAFDIAFDAEDLLNPNNKPGGIKLDELGSNERVLVVKNAKPSEREKVERVVAMFDTPDFSRRAGIRIIDSKVPPAQLAKLLEKNWPGATPLEIKGSLDSGPVHVIDIHADEPPETIKPVKDSSVTPCVLPASLSRSLAAITQGLSEIENPEGHDHSKYCPICHQHACALPAHLSQSLAAIINTSFDDPIYDQPAAEETTTQPAEHNHVVEQSEPAALSAETAEQSTTQRELGGTLGAAAQAVKGVTLLVDPDTNKLIATGSEEALDELEEIIKELEEGDSPPVINVFPLRHADVNTATQLLEQVFNQGQAALSQKKGKQQQQPMVPVQMPGQPGQPNQPQQQGRQQPQQVMVPQAPTRIKVVPDVRTRSLMVVSPAQDVPLIVDVLKKIDMRVPPAEGTLKFFKLVNLDAAQVAESLREIFSVPSQAGRRGGRPGQPGQPQTPEQQAQQQIIQMQGGQPGQPGQAQGATISSTDNLKITAETQTNTIIAQGPPDTLALIESTIKQLEEETNTTQPKMKRVQLEHARATDIASIAKEVASATAGPGGGGGGPGGGGGGGRRGSTGQVSVTADARTNSVIIAGQTKDVERVEGIIHDLDKDSGDNAIQQFAVKGDANAIATSLKALFASGPNQQDIVITADASTGTVLVKAGGPQMAEIAKQIKTMDDKVAAKRDLRTIKMLVADAETIGPKLQEMFANAQGKSGAKQNIIIKGNKSNSTLYVSGADDDVFKEISKVAKDMDTQPKGIQVKSFALKHASAIDINDKLTQMMAKAMATGGLGDVKLDLVGVVPDARTNSLIVTGGPITFLLIDDVLKAIDVESPTPIARETKSYVLPGAADANTVAGNINALFSAQSFQKTGIEPPSVTANPASNIVIVQANALQHEQIQKNIIDPIKLQVGQPLQDFQVPLKFAQADDVKTTIEDFMTKWKTARGNKPQDNFTITADPNSNMLLVNCTPETKVVFDKQLAELDKESAATQAFRSPKTYVLKYANPESVRAAIVAAFTRGTARQADRDQVTPNVDWNTSSVLVLASEKNHEKVAEIVKMMDVVGQAGQMQDFLYKVVHARATELATVLNNQVRNTRKAVQGQPFPITISGDDGANSLVVTSTLADFESVKKLIEQLDIPSAADGDREQHIYKLVYADPGSASNAIRTVFAPVGRGNPSPRDQVMVADDWTTNSVIVSASKDKHAQIAKIIEDMDKPGEAKRTENVIELVNGNAQDIATGLQQMFDAQNAGRRQRSSATVRAVPGTTKIICFANEAELAQIQNVVSKLDTIEGGRSVHTVAMPEMVPAKSVAENITKLFGTQAGGKEGVKAEYHEPTNTLLLFASDAEFEKINKQVIEVVAKQPTIGALQIYKIKLNYAVADEVAKTLQDFFDKKGGVKRGQSDLPPWMRSGETAATKMDNQVSITAEPTSNMLLVYCTEATKKIVDEIVKEIDTDAPQGGREMQMVALKYMDATEMIGILTEYLKVAKRSPSDENKQPIPWWMDARQEKTEDKVVLAGDMRLRAVESLNAIIVAGRPEGVADALKKIKELDVERTETADTPQRIVLANGNATDIADTVNKLFNDPKREKAGGASYLKPIIVAEDATNSIMFRGSTKDFNLVKNMVTELDQQMKEIGGGASVRILQVAAGRNLEDLANTIEKQLNAAEDHKQKQQKDYKPSLVKIAGDQQSGALIVTGSKAKYDEAKAIVEQLATLSPPGGTTRVAKKLQTLTPEQVKQLIDSIQKSGTQGGVRQTGGPRGDAAWTNQRRYQIKSGINNAQPLTLQGILAHATYASAVGQGATQPIRGGASTQPSGDMAKEIAKLAEQSGVDLTKMSPEAQSAFRKKLSGAPIEVTPAGEDNIVIGGNPEDVEVILSIIEMLDQATPAKQIEYVSLKNAQAKNLAETLKKVFEPLEVKGERKARPEDKVDIIADLQTNGLYIAATEEKMAQAKKLIEQNEAAAVETVRNVKPYTFKNRRVKEVGEVLRKMVASYLKQKSLDPNLITIEDDPQTNSVLISAGQTDLQFVMKLIEGLDAEPLPDKEDKRPMGEADVMIIPLKIAAADKLATLLNEMLKKAATGETPMKDFIRRLRILDDQGRPIETINLDRPIIVSGDPDSNTLLVASTKENALIMKHVAQAFDVEPARAPVVTQVITLKFADATEVAEQINTLLKESETLTKRPGKGDASGKPEGEAGALVYKAVVTADPRTNQIMVIGRPDAVPILTGIITSLDVKGLDVMPFEIVKLEYASPSALETALTEMMKDRAEALPKGKSDAAAKAEKVIIKGDPRARSLIVAAKPARMEELRGLIKKLDIPATALIEDIRTITLRKGSAKDLADKLTKLWEERAKQQEAGSKGMKLETPAIVSDERSNSIIVAASKGDFEAIKAVVDKIEALELNPLANIRIVQLKFNSAKQLKAAFQTLFEKRAEMRGVDGKTRPEDKVAIEVDEVTNSLIFAGSQENFDVLLAKIAELDTEQTTPGVVEYFVATNVGAQRVKDTIDELFKEGVYRPGASAESDTTKARNKVTVTIDQRANILIVSASPENMEVVREIFTRMNSVKTPWDVAITRMLDITHGDAVKIAAQVQDYFEKLDKVRNEGAGDAKSKGGFGITIFADERSNRVIIGGTKDGIDSAVELVGRLDVPPGTPGQVMEVYKLTEAPAAKIGEMIKKVFEERNKPREGDTGSKVKNVPVTIESNATTNSLLINASREDHILIKDLVTRLDRPSTIGEMTRVIPLEKAPAARVKEILEELYKSKGGEGGDKGGASIAVVEDTRTNAVVVTAPPGELDNITALVRRLDETEVKGQAELGVFPVENEDAKKMAELLNSIMTGKGGPEGSTEGTSGGGDSKTQRDVSSLVISFADKDPRGREIFFRTIRENVQITYNERTNSIIAVAPPQTLRMIEHLVRRLDQIQKRAVLVKVFTLTNADATKMVELLENMFAQEEGKENERDFQQGREITVEGGSSNTSGVPTAASQGGAIAKGTFGRPKTTFVADERTNSIIVAGWPEDIDVVADVIDQLDSRPIQDRENIVYSLVNATAEDVQSALETYFGAEADRLDALSETVSPQRRMEQEVNVVAHEESNQLILSVSPRYKNDVLQVIEELDKAPPQVMIQVMIAEVSLDDRFEMGLEFALQELKFSETAVAGGNGVLQSSHFDVVGGTDLGAAGSGLGGFSFTITGEDFNFLVRALQADSRLEIIQRPMIMCQDNQQAQIMIGQQVPIPRGSSTAFGQVNTSVQYQQVGVILNVEPHINPDGFVYMLVEPEISSLSESTIQTAPGSFAPIINSRKASTNVAVKDGETVVIGGLITTTENESESKVPLLGDLPGVGVLFRTTSRTKQKTELLIALTPRVVRTVEDGRRISIEARDESGIITPEMKQSPLMKGLQVKPETPDEVEDLEVAPEMEGDDRPEYEGEEELEPVDEGRPMYGPEVPRYGPMVPSGTRATKPEAVEAGQ